MADPDANPEDAGRRPEHESQGATVTQRLAVRRSGGSFPDRYRIGEETGRIVCIEAPTIQVVMERGLSVSASAARNYAAGSIFLDGAAQAPPFLDVEKRIYNLDHHEGCVRPFTLSTCEQAYLLLAKGLDLQSRAWTLYANEPDLDTLLAVWVLLNHRRLATEEEVKRKVIPLLRLEGAIDVHGFDLREICGFPEEMDRALFASLEEIGQAEIEVKREGRWQDVDFVEFTADRLRFIDEHIYQEGDFKDLAQVEELARAELPQDRMAIACRSTEGIYRVEEQLGEIYGDRLGLVILQKDPGTYTLRQVDSFLSTDLTRVYETLNLVDPAAGNSLSANRWGGSADIGGSPRTTGTRLTAAQITEVCSEAYRKLGPARRLSALLLAAILSGAATAAAALPFAVGLESTLKASGFAAAILLLGSLTLIGTFWRGPGWIGLRKPVGLAWLALAPLAVLAAIGGGSWALSPSLAPTQPPLAVLLATIGFALGTEALFRGVVYGQLQFTFLSTSGRRPLLSLPLVISSLLYGLWSLLPFFPLVRRPLTTPDALAATFAAALAFGLICGLSREHSESLFPPVLLHLAAAITVVVAGIG